MAVVVSLEVSYGQFAIFDSSISQPFNDWTDQHVAQGFSWRPESASFRTLVETGLHSFELVFTERFGEINTDSLRVIEVPFQVPENGSVELASISDAVSLNLPCGIFALRCEFSLPLIAEIQRVILTFASKESPRFAVVRADSDLTIGPSLVTTARPA